MFPFVIDSFRHKKLLCGRRLRKENLVVKNQIIVKVF